MLQMMYDGKAAPFQTYALVTRMAARERALHNNQSDALILDRWMDDDKLFARVNLTDNEYGNYMEYWTFVNRMHPIGPSFVVHLKTDVSVCLSRIRGRGRAEERDITAGYLQKLEIDDPCDLTVINNGDSSAAVAEIKNAFLRWKQTNPTKK